MGWASPFYLLNHHPVSLTSLCVCGVFHLSWETRMSCPHLGEPGCSLTLTSNWLSGFGTGIDILLATYLCYKDKGCKTCLLVWLGSAVYTELNYLDKRLCSSYCSVLSDCRCHCLVPIWVLEFRTIGIVCFSTVLTLDLDLWLTVWLTTATLILCLQFHCILFARWVYFQSVGLSCQQLLLC